jgi:hypothetical protein
VSKNGYYRPWDVAACVAGTGLGLTSAASPGVDIWSTCKVGHTWRVSLSVDMRLSAVSVLVIVLQSPEIPEGLMNNPVQWQYINSFDIILHFGYL